MLGIQEKDSRELTGGFAEYRSIKRNVNEENGYDAVKRKGAILQVAPSGQRTCFTNFSLGLLLDFATNVFFFFQFSLLFVDRLLFSREFSRCQKV